MGFKVFDLQCEQGHLFEGWFRSHEDYEMQQSKALVTCPMCNVSSVHRVPSAPRLNMGATEAVARNEPQSTPTESTSESHDNSQTVSPEVAQLQASILQHMRKVVQSAENVGTQFAHEARRMHEGESKPRPIRGVATPQERESLAEEGITVYDVPDFLDDDRLN